MFDAATARRHMVDGQIRTADVTNPDLIAAMQAIPRENFVAPELADQAYRDGDVSIGHGRALLRPIVLGKLLQGANVRVGDQVLNVGCGTGYSAAVLAHMGTAVVALEQDPDLARQAESALAAIGARQVTVVTGPLVAGWPAAAPYDLILLDVEMPGIDGLELCKRLRALPAYEKTPVIYVTIHSDFETQSRTLMSGGNDLIAKPIQPAELAVKAVMHLLKHSKAMPDQN